MPLSERAYAIRQVRVAREAHVPSMTILEHVLAAGATGEDARRVAEMISRALPGASHSVQGLFLAHRAVTPEVLAAARHGDLAVVQRLLAV